MRRDNVNVVRSFISRDISVIAANVITANDFEESRYRVHSAIPSARMRNRIGYRNVSIDGTYARAYLVGV